MLFRIVVAGRYRIAEERNYLWTRLAARKD